MKLGVHERSAWSLAKSGKGWWRLSGGHALHQAMNNTWFKEQGLISLIEKALVKV